MQSAPQNNFTGRPPRYESSKHSRVTADGPRQNSKVNMASEDQRDPFVNSGASSSQRFNNNTDSVKYVLITNSHGGSKVDIFEGSTPNVSSKPSASQTHRKSSKHHKRSGRTSSSAKHASRSKKHKQHTREPREKAPEQHKPCTLCTEPFSIDPQTTTLRVQLQEATTLNRDLETKILSLERDLRNSRDREASLQSALTRSKQELNQTRAIHSSDMQKLKEKAVQANRKLVQTSNARIRALELELYKERVNAKTRESRLAETAQKWKEEVSKTEANKSGTRDVLTQDLTVVLDDIRRQIDELEQTSMANSKKRDAFQFYRAIDDSLEAANTGLQSLAKKLEQTAI
ncbi:hypothetical protein HK102_012244 [Quaeritorhiza haematococci]|nr:hypothetical protein HK102_012244 [Quaeritorhiza haematococci]